MIAAIRDLAKTGGPHSVVVVTGGPDSCNADAGELIAQEAARAGIELQTFVVGFLVDESGAQAIKGMIDQTPGGLYLDAPDEDTLRNILEAVQAHIDDPATTPTSQILAAATPQATLNFGHTACDYEYWPLRQSASWLYAGPNGEWSDGVASVIGDDVSATVTIVHEVPGVNRADGEWTCTVDGITPGNMLDATYSGQTTETEVVSTTGVWLPASDQLVPGASWEFAQTYTQSILPAATTATVTASRKCTVSGPESVTVPAGTFDAIRLDCNETLGDTAGAATNTESKYWYAKGVGLVRQEISENDGAAVVSELSSYYSPSP
jgi:hypothetical protein